jgi:hypothetical protein
LDANHGATANKNEPEPPFWIQQSNCAIELPQSVFQFLSAEIHQAHTSRSYTSFTE